MRFSKAELVKNSLFFSFEHNFCIISWQTMWHHCLTAIIRSQTCEQLYIYMVHWQQFPFGPVYTGRDIDMVKGVNNFSSVSHLKPSTNMQWKRSVYWGCRPSWTLHWASETMHSRCKCNYTKCLEMFKRPPECLYRWCQLWEWVNAAAGLSAKLLCCRMFCCY